MTKLVWSRFKWVGLVERLADEKIVKGADAQKVEG
jgi:hypothetical protein